MTERRKNKAKNGLTSLLFIYFITVNKYRFCISVIGYINVQIIGIGIGYKKSISVDHKFVLFNIFGETDVVIAPSCGQNVAICRVKSVTLRFPFFKHVNCLI